MTGSPLPKIIEKILAALIPPACRDEVLGDLYEGCTTLTQYIFEALLAVPMVILSRIRRIADPEVLLLQGTTVYVSFMGAAWYQGQTSLLQHFGFLKLAIPSLWVLLGVIIEDVYSSPGRRSVLRQVRGPVLGLGFAYLSQIALSTGVRMLALPSWLMFFGSALGLLSAIGVKLLFPPATDRQVGAGGPAFWLKHTAEPLRISPEVIWIIKSLAFVLVLAFIGGQVGGTSLAVYFAFSSALLIIFREVKRRW